MLYLTYIKRKDKTIVDYYKDLPAYFFFDKDFKNLKYTLNQKKGIWVSQSLEGHEFFPIVNVKKGYIKINDEGTGGGNVSFELFLFKKSNGQPIIVITKGGFDGFYYDSTTRFYTLENNIWIEAKNIFPKFGISQFLKDYDTLVFKNDSLFEPNLSLLIQLNPNNFTATLSPNFDKYNFLIDYHLNTLTQKPFTDEAYDKLVGIVKNIAIESFQLEFNKSLGRFEVRDFVLRKNKNTSHKFTDKDIILNKLSKLKIVRDLAFYIDSASQKKRSLELIIVGEDQNNSNYIIVKAMEDNGGNFVTHLTFKVQKDNYEVLLYAPMKDKYLKVE
jgi:hypothetical protein